MRYYTSDSQQERSRFCTPNVQIERERKADVIQVCLKIKTRTTVNSSILNT